MSTNSNDGCGEVPGYVEEVWYFSVGWKKQMQDLQTQRHSPSVVAWRKGMVAEMEKGQNGVPKVPRKSVIVLADAVTPK